MKKMVYNLISVFPGAAVKIISVILIQCLIVSSLPHDLLAQVSSKTVSRNPAPTTPISSSSSLGEDLSNASLSKYDLSKLKTFSIEEIKSQAAAKANEDIVLRRDNTTVVYVPMGPGEKAEEVVESISDKRGRELSEVIEGYFGLNEGVESGPLGYESYKKEFDKERRDLEVKYLGEISRKVGEQEGILAGELREYSLRGMSAADLALYEGYKTSEISAWSKELHGELGVVLGVDSKSRYAQYKAEWGKVEERLLRETHRELSKKKSELLGLWRREPNTYGKYVLRVSPLLLTVEGMFDVGERRELLSLYKSKVSKGNCLEAGCVDEMYAVMGIGMLGSRSDGGDVRRLLINSMDIAGSGALLMAGAGTLLSLGAYSELDTVVGYATREERKQVSGDYDLLLLSTYAREWKDRHGKYLGKKSVNAAYPIDRTSMGNAWTQVVDVLLAEGSAESLSILSKYSVGACGVRTYMGARSVGCSGVMPFIAEGLLSGKVKVDLGIEFSGQAAAAGLSQRGMLLAHIMNASFGDMNEVDEGKLDKRIYNYLLRTESSAALKKNVTKHAVINREGELWKGSEVSQTGIMTTFAGSADVALAVFFIGRMGVSLVRQSGQIGLKMYRLTQVGRKGTNGIKNLRHYAMYKNLSQATRAGRGSNFKAFSGSQFKANNAANPLNILTREHLRTSIGRAKVDARAKQLAGEKLSIERSLAREQQLNQISGKKIGKVDPNISKTLASGGNKVSVEGLEGKKFSRLGSETGNNFIERRILGGKSYGEASGWRQNLLDRSRELSLSLEILKDNIGYGLQGSNKKYVAASLITPAGQAVSTQGAATAEFSVMQSMKSGMPSASILSESGAPTAIRGVGSVSKTAPVTKVTTASPVSSAAKTLNGLVGENSGINKALGKLNIPVSAGASAGLSLGAPRIIGRDIRTPMQGRTAEEDKGISDFEYLLKAMNPFAKEVGGQIVKADNLAGNLANGAKMGLRYAAQRLSNKTKADGFTRSVDQQYNVSRETRLARSVAAIDAIYQNAKASGREGMLTVGETRAVKGYINDIEGNNQHWVLNKESGVWQKQYTQSGQEAITHLNNNYFTGVQPREVKNQTTASNPTTPRPQITHAEANASKPSAVDYSHQEPKAAKSNLLIDGNIVLLASAAPKVGLEESVMPMGDAPNTEVTEALNTPEKISTLSGAALVSAQTAAGVSVVDLKQHVAAKEDKKGFIKFFDKEATAVSEGAGYLTMNGFAPNLVTKAFTALRGGVRKIIAKTQRISTEDARIKKYIFDREYSRVLSNSRTDIVTTQDEVASLVNNIKAEVLASGMQNAQKTKIVDSIQKEVNNLLLEKMALAGYAVNTKDILKQINTAHVNAQKIISAFSGDVTASKKLVKDLKKDLTDIKRQLSPLVSEIEVNNILYENRTKELDLKEKSVAEFEVKLQKAKEVLADLDAAAVDAEGRDAYQEADANYKKIRRERQQVNQELKVAQDKQRDALQRIAYYKAYADYFSKREQHLERQIAYLNGENKNLSDVIDSARNMSASAEKLAKETSVILEENRNVFKSSADAKKSNERDLEVFSLIKKRSEERSNKVSHWAMLEGATDVFNAKAVAEVQFLRALSAKKDGIVGAKDALKDAALNMQHLTNQSSAILLKQAVEIVKPHVDGRYAIAQDNRWYGHRVMGHMRDMVDFVISSVTGNPGFYYRTILKTNIKNVVNNLNITTQGKNDVINAAADYLRAAQFTPSIEMARPSALEFDIAYDADIVPFGETLQNTFANVKKVSVEQALEKYTNDKKTSAAKTRIAAFLGWLTGKTRTENNMMFNNTLRDIVYKNVNDLDVPRSVKLSILNQIMHETQNIAFKAPKVKADKLIKGVKGKYHKLADKKQMGKPKPLRIMDSSEDADLKNVNFFVDPRLKVKSDKLFWKWEKDKYILQVMDNGRYDALTRWYMEVAPYQLAKLAIVANDYEKNDYVLKLVNVQSYKSISGHEDVTSSETAKYPLYVRTPEGDVLTNLLIDPSVVFEFKDGYRVVIDDNNIIMKTAHGSETVLDSAQLRLPKNKFGNFVKLIKSINGKSSAAKLDVLVRFNRDKLNALNWASAMSLSSLVRNMIGVVGKGMDLTPMAVQALPMAAYAPNLLASYFQKLIRDLGNDKILKLGLKTTLGTLVIADVMAFKGIIEPGAPFWVVGAMILIALGLGLGSSLTQQTTKDLVSKNSVTSEHNSANNAQWQLFKQYGSIFVSLPYAGLKLITMILNDSGFLSENINLLSDSIDFYGVFDANFFTITYPLLTFFTARTLYKVYRAGYKDKAENPMSLRRYMGGSIANGFRGMFAAVKRKITGEKLEYLGPEHGLKNAHLKTELKRLGIKNKLSSTIYNTTIAIGGQQAMDASIVILGTGTVMLEYQQDGAFGLFITIATTMIPAILARMLAKYLITKKIISDDEVLAMAAPIGAIGVPGFLLTYAANPLLGSMFVFFATLGLSNYQAQAMGVIEKTIYSAVDKEISAAKAGRQVEGEFADIYKTTENAKKLYSPYISALFNRLMAGVGGLTFLVGIVATLVFAHEIDVRGLTVEMVDADENLKMLLKCIAQLKSGWVAALLVAIPIIWQRGYIWNVIKSISTVRAYQGPLSQTFDISRREINAARRRHLRTVNPQDWANGASWGNGWHYDNNAGAAPQTQQ
ncbi:hypothetical protein AAIR98_001059 [Elusimicrobium simillimum]|uniref:hypothetical protein n=1 Tax=Elusimicrobium simillimum TaxID=3143438 RepID=UPI003C6F8EAF